MEQFNTIVLFGQLADLMEAEAICLEKGYRYQIDVAYGGLWNVFGTAKRRVSWA